MVSLFFFALGVVSTLIVQKKGKQIITYAKELFKDDSPAP